MSIKIAITNEKGGCGKTTSAVNISAILAERGYRVLLADVDPQSYATMYYGLYNADDPSLYDAITGVWPVNDAIVKTVFGVDVLKSNTKSMRLEEMLTEYKLRGRAYNDLLSKLLTPIENDYDYIIIDCPPQGYKLLENVQRYADYILIPMIPDEFALHSLRIKAESLIEISISKSDTTIIGSILCNSLSDPQFCGYSFLTNNRHAKRADGENF